MTTKLGGIELNPKNPETQTQEMIVRHVKVDRTRTPQEMLLDVTGQKQYVDSNVLTTMPHGEGKEVELYYFKPEPWEYTRQGYMSPEDLEKCYALRGLKPEPYAQTQDNADNPNFADTHPNATQWNVSDEQSSFVAFARFDARRYVIVTHIRDILGYEWLFAGVRKDSQEPPLSDYADDDRNWEWIHGPLPPSKF